MKNVTYISAGAGSGKTYTLTKTLAELVEGSKTGYEKAVPERVILTTFTVKAASEFKERAKAFLYEKGLNDEAGRMDRAMMGTIHSIAYAFINKYWFHLGLCPNMNVLLEEDVSFYVSQSLSELPTEKELICLRAFRDSFDFSTPWSPGSAPLPNYDYWKNELISIIGLSTNYGISDYSSSRKKSADFYRQFVKTGAHVNVDPVYLRALIEAETRCLSLQNESGAKQERQRKLRALKRTVDSAGFQWLKTFDGLLTKTDLKREELLSDFREKYNDIWQSDYLYQTVEEHINLIFDLADRWRENYTAYKRKKKLLDYDDMEKYMYELLQMPEVSKEIAGSFDYLFVDEFQDCSPIQVKIFDKLSDLVKHSWWVGDFKQAIYGFRGSDTELTKAVVDKIESGGDGCCSETLDTSYRSLPDIVDLTNKAFTVTFDGVLPEDKVALKTHRENTQDIRSLRTFACGGSSGDIADLLPSYIKDLLARGVKPKDIAVLARTNTDLAMVDECLSRDMVPSSRAGVGVAEHKVTLLMQALLSLVLNTRDNLARASIALLTEAGYGTGEIIDAKLQYDSQEGNKVTGYLDDIKMVKKLLSILPELRQQSISALVESLIIELNLYDFVRSWDDYKQSIAVLHTIDETAKQYEEHSIQMNLPATINGFIDYLKVINPACPGDENGIQLITCHGAKGLEWKYVFLMSLNYDPVEERKMLKREIFGVHAIHDTVPTKDNLFPEVSIMVCPWLYGDKGRASAPEVIRNKVVASDAYEQRKEAVIAEANRLFYVAVTRASDVLTLAVTEKDDAFSWPLAIGLKNAGSSTPGKHGWDCLGIGKKFLVLDSEEDEQEDLKSAAPDDEFGYVDTRLAVPFAKEKCDAPLKYQQPSAQAETTKATLLFETGHRIPLGKMGSYTMADVGTCIHNIFCTMDNGQESTPKEYVDTMGMSEVLPSVESISAAWEALITYLEKTYGSSISRYHELPFTYCEGGQIFTGSMDFVWQTHNGNVLVDFKTCPKGRTAIMDPDDSHYAGHYAGQFRCYEKALVASGNTVISKIVYYPVSGLIVNLE